MRYNYPNGVSPEIECLSIYTDFTLRHPYLFACVVVSGITLQASSLAAPLYLRQFFNMLAANSPQPEIVSNLVQILTVVVAIWFLDWLSHRIRDMSTMYLQTQVMTGIFTSSFAYLLGHSHNFFISQFAGSLTHKVSKFSRAYETMFDSVILQFMPTLLFAGAATILFSAIMFSARRLPPGRYVSSRSRYSYHIFGVRTCGARRSRHE